MTLAEKARKRFTDYEPGVARLFIACRLCGRVVPYYRVYGKKPQATGTCYCGHDYFRPKRIPEWKAALWLVWAWARGKPDPRMPHRTMTTPYA